MNLIGPIFYSNDLTASIEFYKKLGLELEETQGDKFARFGFLGGNKLGIKRADKEREKPGSQTAMIQVADIEKIYKEIQLKDVIIKRPLTNEAWGTTFIISDPDGNWIEFLE